MHADLQQSDDPAVVKMFGTSWVSTILKRRKRCRNIFRATFGNYCSKKQRKIPTYVVNIRLNHCRTLISFAESANIRRTSLLFENKPKPMEIVDAVVILKLLDELGQSTTNGTEEEAPRLFSSLVYYLRNLDFARLTEIFGKIKHSPVKK